MPITSARFSALVAWTRRGTYQALAITAPPDGPAMPVRACARGLGRWHTRRNEFDTALWHITQGIPAV
jgi:hypothetical protein